VVEVNITDEQRANLATLAAYLRTLPADYPDFAMDQFVRGVGGYADSRARRAECGTAACAAGHGPIAGIEPLQDETWYTYTVRAFGRSSFTWCFDEDWAQVDNSAHGAAARIEFMLAHGIPENADEQRFGEDPLCYTTQASPC